MPWRVRGTSMSAALRRKPLENPSAAMLAIAQAVMQAMRGLLPEFDFVGMDTITSPVYGTRRGCVGILGCEFGEAGFQYGAGLDDGALARREGGHAALAGARGEVGVGFSRGEFRHASGNADLAVHSVP